MQSLFKQALLVLSMMLTATFTYGQTQSGTLDPSFGTGGAAINDFGGRIALLPDGKMLAAGGASAADGFDFSLSRFNSNGTPDTSFGSGGRVTTDLGGRFEGATSIVLQPDGKIVTAGYAVVPVNQFANFALVRYNSDGSLDLSFGTGGKVLTNFGNISAQAYSMVLQPDGKIVLAGYVNFNGGESFGLARYNTDGTLDAGFGSGGKVHTEFSAAGQTGSVAFAYSLALQQDGKIVAAGESTINGQRDFAVARYNSNGTLDLGFGAGGKVNTDFMGFDDLAHDVTIQPDGRIVAAGAAATGTAASVLFDFALARYNSNGTLDPTFGSGGKLTTDFSGAQDFVNSIILQPDGRIIAAGQATINGLTDGAFGLARYFSNGTLDPSFGTGGKVTTNFGTGSDQIGQLLLLQDGKILAAGGANINGISKSVLARYLNDSSSPIPTPTPTPTPTPSPTPAPVPSPTPATQNPIDDIPFFVTQQYIDFFGRQPDSTGLANWVATLNGCPNGGFGENANPGCDRVHVSAGFFLSDEFQGRGYFAYRFYEVALDRRPMNAEFATDMTLVGGAQSPESEVSSKAAYTQAWTQRPEFKARYDGLSNSAYVNALESNAEVTVSNKQALIDALNANQMNRGQVLRDIVESSGVANRFFNRAFVTMQYFGYLRRDPDEFGFQNWVNTLNADPSNFRHMIFGFLFSNEYRQRFGP